ncbi:MAG: phosphatase PAP2 family protein [Nanoarchaeota archaeon]|nr:phosphatase PAP2 family protein [Nanoarchaeota archaeon]
MKTSEKRSLVFLWILIAFAIFLSFYFDGQIVQLISLIRNSVLTDFFMGITFVSSILLIFLFLTLLFIKEKKRKWILPLWMSLGLSVIVSFLLKVSIQRQRPFELGLVSVIEGLAKNSHMVWNFSFPSFQAMLVFSAIPFLDKEFPKFKYVWIAFACLVAFSRVYLGLHFLSDVIVGSVIGYLIGFFIVKWWKEKFRL